MFFACRIIICSSCFHIFVRFSLCFRQVSIMFSPRFPHFFRMFVSFFHLFPQTGLPVWGSYSLARVACLGPMILTVSPGLRPQSVGSGWSHDFLHLSPICLSFGSHSGSCWSHDFLHLSSIGLSFVSTCLPLWVRLVA